MAVLGDSPMFFFNTLGENLGNGLSGGAPFFLGIFGLGILIYLALTFKLDRGALAFLGLLFMGVAVQLHLFGMAEFFLVLAIVALVAGYGFLNSSRQGEG